MYTDEATVVNFVFSVLELTVIFGLYASRRRRAYWLKGSALGTALFLVVFAVFWVKSEWFWSPRPNEWIDFPPVFFFVAISSMPISGIFEFLLGSNNFVKTYLMLPTAILVWCVFGAVFGALFGKIKNRIRAK